MSFSSDDEMWELLKKSDEFLKIFVRGKDALDMCISIVYGRINKHT